MVVPQPLQLLRCCSARSCAAPCRRHLWRRQWRVVVAGNRRPPRVDGGRLTITVARLCLFSAGLTFLTRLPLPQCRSFVLVLLLVVFQYFAVTAFLVLRRERGGGGGGGNECEQRDAADGNRSEFHVYTWNRSNRSITLAATNGRRVRRQQRKNHEIFTTAISTLVCQTQLHAAPIKRIHKA